MSVLAAGVALLGSMFFALGAAFQQHEAARSAEPSLRVLLRRPRWLLGGASIAVGGSLHIFALSIGPLTMVQPMGVASLLFALPIAAALHGRRPTGREIAAACVVSIGLIGLVLLVPPSVKASTLTGSGAATMLAGTALTALLCFGLARRSAGAARAALLAVAAGVMYGATATITRVLVEGPGWNLWLLAVLPLPAVTALMLLQRAYATPARRDASRDRRPRGEPGTNHFAVAFATLQVTDPLTAVTCGTLLLGEPLPANALAGVAAALLAGAGTVALARTTPLTR
ncbi:DMT family transporter [Sphaerisporangium perillae]|uniref:DMT family transporter n=1 Tax=Sphaerisporangium perillae TaxID=2935860 RepID=UPI00200FF976|nr:DMT family transporter [Sphaerisporangium perillae]